MTAIRQVLACALVEHTHRAVAAYGAAQRLVTQARSVARRLSSSIRSQRPGEPIGALPDWRSRLRTAGKLAIGPRRPRQSASSARSRRYRSHARVPARERTITSAKGTSTAAAISRATSATTSTRPAS